jgi:hypothetical protein
MVALQDQVNDLTKQLRKALREATRTTSSADVLGGVVRHSEDNPCLGT